MCSLRGGEPVLTFLKPILCLLEGADGLLLPSSQDGCLAQTQQQGSPLAVLRRKQVEGDAIVLESLLRCAGLKSLLGSATSVVRSACPIPTAREVEGQISEMLRTLLVSLCFQDATDEAMQAPSAQGGKRSHKAFTHFIVTEGQ